MWFQVYQHPSALSPTGTFYVPFLVTHTYIHCHIFLDLRKAYDDLDMELCLGILEGYGVGTRTIRILRTYWSRIQMAAKSGGHYGTAFQIHHGVTQGNPLSPTIFNMVVDTVIRHWVAVVGGPQEGSILEGLGTSIQDLLALFYAYDVLVASPESTHLQEVFDALTGLFNHVGIQTNEGNTVGIEYMPCHTPQEWSMEAYTRRVTGRGI